MAIIAKSTPQIILNKIHQIDKNIEFTFEVEINNKLNFLDVSITYLTNQSIKTIIYCKPTHNNELNPFKCKTQYAYKEAAICAFKVCSNKFSFTH